MNKTGTELESLKQEARKYRSAEEFEERYSRNNTVNDVRNIVSTFDETVNKMNQRLTGKEIKLSNDVERGLEAKKTKRAWSGSVKSINNLDRRLFAETKRALLDFYQQGKDKDE